MKGAFLSGNPTPHIALSATARRSRQAAVMGCVAIALVSVVGCGQKGPLTLPKPELQTPLPAHATPSTPPSPTTPTTPETPAIPPSPASPL